MAILCVHEATVLSGFKKLPRGDFIVLVAAIWLNIIVFSAAIYTVYVNPPTYTTTFKVFEVYLNPSGELTRVLTYGKGKLVFIGDYTDTFQAEHIYTVTCVPERDPIYYRIKEVYLIE